MSYAARMRSRVRRRPQVGAAGGYGDTQAQSWPGFSAPGCAPACEPTVVGNAGVPGCGTGTIPGTECSLKLLFRNSGTVAAAATIEIEALAGRGGAFKPRAVYMVGIGDADSSVNVRFEILNVTVLGNPQLISYDGLTVLTNRGLSDFFNLQCAPQPVDWAVIGASPGQGLNITVANIGQVDARLYVAVWGDAAEQDLIGK